MITLYPSQETSAMHLIKALSTYGAALDASDTGTGKTYVACAVARALKSPETLVVCPKSVIPTWNRVASATGCSVTPVSYEKLRYGSTKWLRRIDRKKFAWAMDPGSLVIFDEAHRCSGYESQLSVLMALTRAYRLKTLMLSATLAESPLKMRAAGFLLGLHNFAGCYRWLLANGCRKGFFGGLEPPPASRLPTVMSRIHAQIFPERGVRLRADEMPEFPESQIIAEAYAVEDPREIDKALCELQSLLLDAQNEGSALTEQLRLRQIVELCKVGTFIELAEDAVEEGHSVAVFVSFRETLSRLHARWPDAGILHGDLATPERAKQIEKFQSGETPFFICTISAGGSGVSLHDLDGSRPRLALISPTFNAQEMKQVFGRVHRAGGKSKSIQRIVYASDTIEEHVARRLNVKLKAMEAFNDGDLSV